MYSTFKKKMVAVFFPISGHDISKKSSISIKKTYSLVDQLQHTPTQILIFYLLEFSPTHKEILENYFKINNVIGIVIPFLL